MVDITLGQMLAPEIVEIRHQRRNVGHGGMQVAIDCAGKGKLHRMPLKSAVRSGTLSEYKTFADRGANVLAGQHQMRDVA